MLSKDQKRRAFAAGAAKAEAKIVHEYMMEKVKAVIASGHDDTNPDFLFSGTNDALVLAIAEGLINPVRLAKWQLASRGLNRNGQWVGFAEAQRIHGVK